MWLTPCSSSSSSVRSASCLETLPSAAAPKMQREDSWPVAPKGARSIMAGRLRPLPQHRVEATRAERLAVDDGVDVARGADRGDDLRLALERPVEVLGGDLEAPEDAVVADAQDGKAERAHRPLGAVDAGERLGIDGGPVRDARREAGRGRLVRARHAQLA